MCFDGWGGNCDGCECFFLLVEGLELTFHQAREVVIIATGSAKALALKKCVEDGINHMWTASCLQNHPCAMFVVDEDATLEMQVKTVKV